MCVYIVETIRPAVKPHLFCHVADQKLQLIKVGTSPSDGVSQSGNGLLQSRAGSRKVQVWMNIASDLESGSNKIHVRFAMNQPEKLCVLGELLKAKHQNLTRP
jgi:hypothetical protein